MNKLPLRSVVFSTFLTDEQRISTAHGLPGDFPDDDLAKFLQIIADSCVPLFLSTSN